MGNTSTKGDMENSGLEYNPSTRPDDHGDIEGFVMPLHVRRAHSVDSMGINTPPDSPRRSRSPLLFAPQVPVAPLQTGTDTSPVFNHLWMNENYATFDEPAEKGTPALITWNLGGKEVLVEGSWDNWAARKTLHRSGKDHAILLVLPSGVHQYKFIVDGKYRYIQDLPTIADEMGTISNILDVHDYVPENLESVAEFEGPASPESSYGQSFPVDEDFTKEPPVVPPQVHQTVFGEEEPSVSEKPQHVVLNHLFIEKGWAPQSLVSLGFSHRFHSKYVTLVIYKPTLV